MRELADEEHIERFMRALGRVASSDGRVYLTGGATAVLNGWRPSTIERSPFIRAEGMLSFHHFDPVAQALAKAEQGHEQDLLDVKEMIRTGLVDPAEVRAQFESIQSDLYRFPAIDPDSFRRSVEDLFG